MDKRDKQVARTTWCKSSTEPTHHGIQASIEKAVPQSETTAMKRMLMVRNFEPFSAIRTYWKSKASLISAVDILYSAFAT